MLLKIKIFIGTFGVFLNRGNMIAIQGKKQKGYYMYCDYEQSIIPSQIRSIITISAVSQYITNTLIMIWRSTALCGPLYGCYSTDFLSMKWQWTYGPTIFLWTIHFHTSDSC